MINKVLARFRGADGSFLKSSAIVAVGFAVARVLGLGFSLILARLMSAEDYGYIQYSITIGMMLAVLTMPLGQHVLARRISEVVKDQTSPDLTFSNFVATFVGSFSLTLVLGIPLLLLVDSFNLGILAIFTGVSLYYVYFGLARGFLASARLSLAFIASNFIQLTAIFVVYGVLGSETPLAAGLIYGLSYLPPIILLTLFSPLPVRFRPSLVNISAVRTLVVETAPVWFSQIAFLVATNVDVLLVRNLAGDSVLGVYAFTRTLCLAFEIIPGGIQTIILPRTAMAATPNARRRLLFIGIGVSIAINAVLLLIFLLVYEPVVRTFFREEYIIPFNIVLIMAVSQSALALQSITTSSLLGMNRAWLETTIRVVMFFVTTVTALLLIPPLGLLGAALSSLVSGLAYFAVFPLLVWWGKRVKQLPAAETSWIGTGESS